MTDDRTLLKKAAKAAGVELVTPTMLKHGKWNPLVDDADAFRLAVKLRLVVHVWDDGERTSCAKTEPDGDDPNPTSDAWHSAESRALGGSLDAATRRAVVLAAAAIGEQT